MTKGSGLEEDKGHFVTDSEEWRIPLLEGDRQTDSDENACACTHKLVHVPWYSC